MDVIINPENYEEMKFKLEERDNERLKQLLEKKRVETKEELKKLAQKEIVNRTLRASGINKPLKDHTIKVEAQSSDILELKKKLNEEITTFAKSLLSQTSSLERKEGLKGRVTPGTPDKESGES